MCRGGETFKQKASSIQRPPRQGTQDQRAPVPIGMAGPTRLQPSGGMAHGEGGGTLPPGRGGPPIDKEDDEFSAEEGDESDSDEETESITSSSQAYAGRIMSQKRKEEFKSHEGGEGGPPEDPNDPDGEGNVGEGRRGPQGHRGQRGRTGPPGRDGVPGPIGLVGP